MAKGNGCAAGFGKVFLIIANTLFILSGVAMITAGSVVAVALQFGDSNSTTCSYDPAHPLDSLKSCYNYLCNLIIQVSGENYCSSLSGLPIGIIVLGGIVFFIAVFGCCGAMKSKSCCLVIYFILMLVIFLCQVAIAIAGFVFGPQFDSFFEQKVWNNAAFAQYKSNFQDTFQCCGWNTVTPPCPTTYSGTCFDRVHAIFNANIVIFAGVAAGVAVFEIISMIASCCVRAGISKDRKEKDQYAQARAANNNQYYATAV